MNRQSDRKRKSPTLSFKQESSKNERAKMSEKFQRRTQVNHLPAWRNEKHRNSDDVSPHVARGNVLIQRRGPGYLGRDILYVPNSTVSLHRVCKKVSVCRGMQVGEVPRIDPENNGHQIVTKTLLICCSGYLFDTQGKNVLNRTEAAAD